MIKNFLKPSPDKVKDREIERQRNELQKQQVKEAQFYAQMIPNALARMKVASITKEKGKLNINKVRITPPVLIHEDYYMVEINTRRLPFGVKVDVLTDEEIIRTLSAACRTQVEAKFSPTEGLWYLIPRRGGLGIIPKMIRYDQVLDLMPKSASKWSFPIGVGENKKLIWVDLRKTPHLLMAGSTGMGKSVFLKCLLLTLANQVPPNQLRFLITDFKMGPDFRPLLQLPHVGLASDRKEKFDRLITEPDDLLPLLQWARSEIDRRNQKFAEYDDITTIDQYNSKHRKRPLPHIILLLDEIPVAMLELPKKQQLPIKQALSGITRLGRSPGVHVILGSQSAGADILDGATGQNIAARVVGYCTGPQSQVALGSWAASKIQPLPGRAMWREGMDEYEIQLPFVDPQTAVHLAQQAVARWAEGNEEEELAITLFRWCLAELEGDYEVNRVYKAFREENIPRADVEMVGRDYELRTLEDGSEGPVFNIDDIPHVLVPPIPGRRPRRVITKERYDQVTKQPSAPVEPHPEPAPPDVEPLDLFRYSLEVLEGNFSYRKLHDGLEGSVSVYRIKAIAQEWEGKTFELDGETYLLKAPDRVNKPRTIVPVRRETWDDPRAPLPDESLEHPHVIADHHSEVGNFNPDDEADELPDWLQPPEPEGLADETN